MVLSVVALVVAGLVVGLGVVIGVFAVAFLDYCPPATCSSGGAVASVGVALLVAVAIGIAGLVVTIMRIAGRRISWPFSAGTLVLCVVALGVGALAYRTAVGG